MNIVGHKYKITIGSIEDEDFNLQRYLSYPVTVTIKNIDYTTTFNNFDTESRILSGIFENGIKIYLYRNVDELILELHSTLDTDNLFDNEEGGN